MREPAVAGMFYPGDARELAASVDAMLDGADTRSNGGRTGATPKAIIAPHAGHVYSGPVAATVYAPLRASAGKIRRVVLLGPSHRVGFRGIAAATATTYRTPLGDIPVDAESIQRIVGLPDVGFLDQAHTQEHSLEVHLPFLQRTLGDFTLVPLVVGDAPPASVAGVLEKLWGGPETLIVISSDLSHYEDYAAAQAHDAKTCARIVALDETLAGEDACGCRPINGLLHLAKQRGLAIEQVDARNSGDTQGPKNRVVGYAAFAIREAATQSLSLAHRQRLLQVARDVILQPLLGNRDIKLDLSQFPPSLREQRAAFVTLNRDGGLRGCIGSLQATRPLVLDVATNAQSAAFKDPRFSPLTLAEFQDVDVHISVLSEPEPFPVASREALIEQLRPGIDGLIIDDGGRRATYLPSVWEQLPTPEQFVRELRRKAGLPADGWREGTQVFRYHTEEFC